MTVTTLNGETLSTALKRKAVEAAAGGVKRGHVDTPTAEARTDSWNLRFHFSSCGWNRVQGPNK